ncbi:hypothetical protein ACFC0D_02165 [Streptomyces sp. NPDC056222]|uniref:hypothetical protein n=1 Tax=Streptomyces sp. NPDC056222 TaxID=3345749 RepID=UPI0035DCCC82
MAREQVHDRRVDVRPREQVYDRRVDVRPAPSLVDAASAAVVHDARQRAAMPQQLDLAAAFDDVAEPDMEGRTTNPATWLRSPENLERLAAFTREADARRRAIADREQRTPAATPGSQEHKQPSPEPGHGPGTGVRL